nr:hypothetical protein [uncultured Vagococcus sp.]
MIYYLWVFILTGVSLVSLISFLMSITGDLNLLKKVKKKKSSLMLNFSLLLTSLVSIGFIIYLFLELKRQIDIFS